MNHPPIGSASPILTCGCGETFTAPVEAVQEMRDQDGVHFATLGFATHAACNSTRCWAVWEADEEAAA